jgi:hypothetical protein
MNGPLERLRHHVSGAVERGEKEAIVNKPYLLIIPERLSPPRPVADFAEASRIYSQMRDESDEGASTWPDGFVNDYGFNVARISYNGKVWRSLEYQPNEQPLFDPYEQERAR